jgi:hypothetical protein
MSSNPFEPAPAAVQSIESIISADVAAIRHSVAILVSQGNGEQGGIDILNTQVHGVLLKLQVIVDNGAQTNDLLTKILEALSGGGVVGIKIEPGTPTTR